MFVIVFLVLAMVGTTVFFAKGIKEDQKAGGTTPICRVPESGRQFMVDTFGHCQTVEELLVAVDAYERKHFTYDKETLDGFIQTFDFQTLMETNRGVCWEFAVFAKCAVNEIAKHKNWDVSVYVVSVRRDDDPSWHHAYNYVVAPEGIYVFDPTVGVCNKQHRKLYRFDGDTVADIYAHAREAGETVYELN